MSDDQSIFSRRDFYHYIWLTPLAEQNRDYGLTELRMAALCAKHDVPCPPRGYWKRQKGLPRPPTKSFAPPDHDGEIILKKTPRFGKPLGRRAPKAPIVVASQPAQILLPLSVPATLPVDPHELVRRMVIQMAGMEVGGNGLLSVREPPVSTDVTERVVERAIILTDTLLKALEHRGHSVQDGKLLVDGEQFTLVFCEAENIVPHVVTKEEAARRSNAILGGAPTARC